SSFAAELEPRKADTLWTRHKDQIPGVGLYKGSAMGGNPMVLIAGTFGGDLIAFDAMTGDTLRRVKSQLGSIFNISFARNANVFSTSSPLKVMIWKWPEMEVIREFTLEKDAVGEGTHVQATLTSDGKRILLAAYDHKGTRAGLYDVETGDHIFKFPASPTMEPKISADDRIALVYTNNPQAYDLTTGKWLATLPSGGNGEVSMDVSEDGRYVAISCVADWEEDGAVTFYDLIEKREVFRRWLDWRDGRAGDKVALAENANGYFLVKAINGKAFVDFHPTITSSATIRFDIKYFSFQFSSDWKYSYGAGGYEAWVSRLNLSTLSSHDERNVLPNVLVSPNPSTGALTVSGLDVTDGPTTWTIADITGTQICDGITTISSGSC
ncbi:MAG TPA: hypothetical protein PLW14_13615, partial [Chlorobiota bacterium]|nr:hypothetical protein [Chlorobiota bacterium]